MSSSKKRKMKRAVMSWLCVAALASSGNLTGILPGIVPAVAASAEEVAADHVLDLQTLISDPNQAPAGVTVSRAKSGYNNNETHNIMEIKISEDGTYKLCGSNFVNGSYFDVKIIAAEGKKVDLICDDVFIKNDEGGCVNTSGTLWSYSETEFASEQYAVNYAVPFRAESGAELTLSGRLIVDTYSVFSSRGSFTAPVFEGDGKVNSDAFSVVSFKDSDGSVMDENYFLGASADNSYRYPADNVVVRRVTSDVPDGVGYPIEKYNLDDKYKCFAAGDRPFDSARITNNADVTCNPSHSAGADGECSYCHKDLNTTIELGKLADYLSGAAEVPDGVSVSTPENYDDFVELTISESGNYRLTGSNYINGAYLDVKIIIDNGAEVTLNCDDAYIKNDRGEYIDTSDSNKPDSIQGEFSYEDDSSGHHIYNFVYPLNIKNGRLTLKGKLYMDTYDSPDGPKSANYIENGSIENPGDICCASIYTGPVRTNNVESKDRGHDFFIKGAEYNAADYYGGYECMWLYGEEPESYTFSDEIGIVLNPDHSLPENGDSCKNCGLAAYTVRFFVNGADKDIRVKVLKGHTVAKPADPVPLPTFKFVGWLTEDNEPFDFENTPITENTQINALFTSCDATKLAVKTKPKTEYSEGDKFDPTGLVLDVLYEDGNSADANYYPESASMFEFSPDKAKQLTVNDKSITITFLGSSVDLPITVSERAVDSFEIKTAPDKTDYIEGEKFDPTGLVITATFDNGVKMDFEYTEDSGITFASDKALTTDDTSVMISFRGKTAEQPVTVSEKQLTGIAVKTAPKTSYTEGNKFDPTGLVLTASYNNGTTADIEYSKDSGITFAPETLSVTDSKVTITYGGKSVELPVTVADKQLAGIAVKTAPKTSYTEGERFDPTGLVLTASYNNGTTADIEYNKDSGITFTPETLSISDSKVTITYGGKSVDLTIRVTKKTSGTGGSGGSSGSSGSSGRNDAVKETNPVVNGRKMTWSDIVALLEKAPVGSEVTIHLNGLTEAPTEVIRVISKRLLKATFVVDSVKSWKTDGAKIGTPATADFTMIRTASQNHDGLRGTEGMQFTINNTNIPTDLEITFNAEQSGKFANLYRTADGRPVFTTCSKVSPDGRTLFGGVYEKGSYIAMLSEFSDVLGDMNNDGVLNAHDASAILKAAAGLAEGANPLAADVNGDGTVNALDASTILNLIVGLN